MELFGDAATELLIRFDGTEGLFRAYREVEFLAPLRAGDFVEVTAKIIKIGNTSRQMEFMAQKVISAFPSKKDPHRAKVLAKPVLVARAIGTCVV
jgi:3-aminobutyryl-CoA ammonia-lyase